MGQPVAREGDQVVGVDTHIVMIPSPGGPVPTPLPTPFTGKLDGALASTVFVEGKAAAVKGSKAKNQPQHVPAGGPFQKPPSNEGTVDAGSATVFFDGKEAARLGDTATTCNDPADAPVGVVAVGSSTVFAG